MISNEQDVPGTERMRQYRRDRLAARLAVAIPLAAAAALGVWFLSVAGGSGSTMASPTEGAGSDRAFWLGAATCAALATALASWRVPKFHRAIPTAGLLVTVAFVAVAISFG